MCQCKVGGGTQIEATWRLIQAVLKSKIEYDYIWLISGQDYPIANRKEIQEYLNENSDYAFIDIAKDNLRHFQKRNEVYYPKCVVGKNHLSRFVKFLWIYITGGRSHTFRIFKRENIVGEWYFGSSWWCLPYNCIREITSLIQNNPKKMEYFKHSLCCDESFFQTMVMQTSYHEKVKNNLTYIDWSNLANSPKVLTTNDFQKIILSGKLMARKLDMDEDAILFDLLDKKNSS